MRTYGYKSELLRGLYLNGADLHRHGFITDQKMSEFSEICLRRYPEVPLKRPLHERPFLRFGKDSLGSPRVRARATELRRLRGGTPWRDFVKTLPVIRLVFARAAA